jgi:hypothetical protein
MDLGFTTGQLIDINLVRLFLQVVTLSDMSTATGAHLLAPEAWDVRFFQDSTLKWPDSHNQHPTNIRSGGNC